MVAWPASLPQSPLIAGFEEDVPETALRTEMDAGPAKLRRRFTASVRPIKYPLILTETQVATLDTFYVTTMQAGTLPFTHTHPRTGAAINARFTKAPKYQPFKDDLWTTILEWEILP